MKLTTEPYLKQKEIWPTEGRHILAHFDETSIVVHQAFRPDIGHFAASHGHFGGDFSFSRMSWFKPNFLWMMYRSGWGTKADQEVTLAVRIKREFFDSVLEQAVPSTYSASSYSSETEWKRAVASSCVRLQWDPDHSPSGASVQRRAIQLGLRDQILKEYAREAIIDIEDISNFVEEQRANAQPENYEHLLMPVERVYIPAKPEVVQRLELSTSD
jgi:hypothetical protein